MTTRTRQTLVAIAAVALVLLVVALILRPGGGPGASPSPTLPSPPPSASVSASASASIAPSATPSASPLASSPAVSTPAASVPAASAAPTAPGVATPTPVATPSPPPVRWVGTWKNTTPDDASGTLEITWVQTATDLDGTLTMAGHACFTDGTLQGTLVGDVLEFRVPGRDQVAFIGRIAGDTVTGTYTISCDGSTGGWMARRVR